VYSSGICACSGVRLLLRWLQARQAVTTFIQCPAVLRKRDDVFAGQVFIMKMIAAVRAQVAVAGEKLAVGEAGLEV
jgi:hypothetical protein